MIKDLGRERRKRGPHRVNHNDTLIVKEVKNESSPGFYLNLSEEVFFFYRHCVQTMSSEDVHKESSDTFKISKMT